ncbi:MAG: ABC transporter permease [Acidobacteria bacterium]|nr:ABC transporter permease [Acidobacteriota bacterium]
MQDIRFAIRTLRKQPIFTFVAVLTLTLGIGANTAIFSLFHHLLLRPLPYPDAERLVFVWNTYPLSGLDKATVSIPDYLDRRDQAPAIEDAGLFTWNRVSLTGDGQPEQLNALSVTPSFFSTLGRFPTLGRAFSEDEAQPGANRHAILTHELWTARFGADPEIVGRHISLNGEEHGVVGVLPADFELPSRGVALLLPFAFTPQQVSDEGRGQEFSTMIARLAPGATIEQLNAQMKTIVDRNLERLPQFSEYARTSGFGAFAVPMRQELVGDTRTPLLIVQAGVFLVLLIACANVANLLLMRATGRMRELAIRTTLGAGRWRLSRQLLTEGIVLSLLGAAGGIALGYAGLRTLLALGEQQLPAMGEATMQPAVLLFTIALALLTGMVFGLVPAVTVLRGNANALLKEDATRGSASRRTGATRALLVVGQTALALMLLVGAGLLIKSFARLQQVDAGFSTDRVLTARVTVPASRYPDAAARRVFWQRLDEQVSRIPGVTAAGFTSIVPFSGTGATGTYSIVGYMPPAGEPDPHGRQEVVGGNYFRAMQIPLLEGRFFTDGDTAEGTRVAIVDEYLAKRYFADRSPLGREIQRGGADGPRFTIVGVVGTINSIDLGEPVTKERIYYPLMQQTSSSMAMMLKTGVAPHTIVPQARAAVWSIDPELPVADVRTMDQWVARSLETRRAPMVLLAVFGAVALVLSAIGIYGVLAFGVAQRVREFGIRQALGADGASILSLVLRQGLRTAALGVAIGLGLSLLLARYIESQLFGVGAYDVQVLAGVTAMLLVVAAAACYIPARRATRIDPMVALRDS